MNITSRSLSLIIILPLLLSLTGCSLMEDIFALGFWAGIIGVVLLVIIIWVIVAAIKKK